MKRLLLLFVFVSCCVPSAKASLANAFITQSGSTSGLCTAGVQNLAFYNNSANWGAGAAQIGPDTIVLLCGVFTGSAGQQNFIVAQGSGTSGHPITILWDLGAIVQAPYFSNNNNTGNGVNTGGNSWLVFDGGLNGIIQNTACGTGLTFATACGSGGGGSVLAGGAGSNIIWKNLHIGPVYSHTNGDGKGSATWGLMTRGGSNWTVGPNNTFTQADVSFFDEFDGGETNLVITGNSFNGTNQDIQMGPTTVGAIFTNVRVDHNTATNWVNWDEPGNGYHHNFFHPFTNVPSSQITGSLLVYANTSQGDMGDHATSMVYIENNNSGSGGTMGSWYIFNNLFDKTNNNAPPSSGIVAVYSANGFLLNNVIRQVDINQYTSFHLYGSATGWTTKNNIFEGGNTYIFDESGATNFNNNDYHGSSNGQPFDWLTGGGTRTFAAWQASCGCDAASITGNPLLNSNMSVQAGSPTIGAGQNLTSLGITALNSDIAGTVRTIPWDMGAWKFGSVTPPPPPGPPPILLSVVIQ